MLSETQIESLREHLEKAQNPLFFYDNDIDGLCSFVILRKLIGRGKGVAVKSYPDLNAQYIARVKEFKSDYVFVLDKPLISSGFLEELDKLSIPLVWIDHHDVIGNDIELKDGFVEVYNPSKSGKGHEPTTYLAYQVSQRKEDLWLAVCGCIADHYLPEFAKDFANEYPEYWTKEKIDDPFDVFFKTEIGKISQAIGFGLKDSITHVVQLQSFLISCKSPADIFSESEINNSFRSKYVEIKNKYDSILKKLDDKCIFGNLIFFDYSGDLSISSEISNEICYKYPGKYVAVAFIKSGVSNISLRGKNIKGILEKILKDFEGATGGGHTDAAGARIRAQDLARFRETLEKEVN